jgi:hypothetical protein
VSQHDATAVATAVATATSATTKSLSFERASNKSVTQSVARLRFAPARARCVFAVGKFIDFLVPLNRRRAPLEAGRPVRVAGKSAAPDEQHLFSCLVVAWRRQQRCVGLLVLSAASGADNLGRKINMELERQKIIPPAVWLAATRLCMCMCARFFASGGGRPKRGAPRSLLASGGRRYGAWPPPLPQSAGLLSGRPVPNPTRLN